MTTQTERDIARIEAVISEFRTTISELYVDALENGVVEDDEFAVISAVEEKIESLERVLQGLRQRLAQENATSEDVERNAGEVERGSIGGIETVGPSLVLDSESIVTGITAHLEVQYAVRLGGSQIAHGTFSNTGVINIDLVRGQEYTLTMVGGAMVHDSNFIMNDTQNGMNVESNWILKPPLKDGGTHDPAIELNGRPTLQPQGRSLMADGDTEWSIRISDITAPLADTSQAGLYFQFSTNATSGYGGSLSAGPADANASTSATTTSSAALSTTIRFTHVDPPAP